jgi:O-antigen/teichoic acid export membrane protein
MLGGFHISKYISSMPGSEGLSPALEPLLATFSRTINDKEAIRHQVSLVLLVVFAIGVPLSCFLYVFSEPFVLLLLGEQWIDFAPVFGILTLLTVPVAIGKVATQIITSTGKVRFLFMYDFYSLILMAATLFYFASSSLETFSATRVLVEFFTISVLFVFATHKIFGSLLLNILFLFCSYSAASLSLAFLSELFFVDNVPYFFSLGIVFLVYSIFSIFLCWLFFILFLRKNEAAHHVIFLLRGVGNKLVGKVKLILKSVVE